MRNIVCSAIVLGLLAVTTQVIAFDSNVPAKGLPSASMYSATMLPELEGVVPWKILAQVEPVKQNSKMVPRFSKDILALDRQPVRVQGFIVPLDMGGDQKHFLIAAVPPSCPFCMPAGPEAMVEVFAKKAVAYGLEPVIVGGKLAVLKDEPSGLLYRLDDAEIVKSHSSLQAPVHNARRE